MANEVSIDRISIEIATDAANAVAPLESLASVLGILKNSLTGLSGLNTISKAIKGLAEHSAGMKIAAVGLSEIAKATEILKGSVAGIKSLSDLTKGLLGLEKVDTNKIAANMEAIAKAAKKLESSLPNLSKMSGLATTLNSLNPALQKTNINLKESSVAAKSSSVSFRQLFNLGAAYIALRRLVPAIKSAITASTAYVENLNLFAVEMGNTAEQADKFVEKFSRVLGMDTSNIMRYIGFFQQITEGIGLASGEAYLISKNLTQLGYDMASFLNIPIDQSMKKLESGLNGISKPLRSVGVNLTQTALQAKLYDMGINVLYKNLSEQTKVQLRYIQIMDSTRKMQGDLARTMITPANALRILGEQFAVTSRMVGNMFIPALNAIVPIAIAALQVIAELAMQLASLFGFKIPKIDYSTLKDTSGGLEDTAEGLGGVSDAAKDTKKAIKGVTAPFDELNDIAQSADEALGGIGGGKGGKGAGIDLDFGDLSKMYDYDATLGAVGLQVDKIKDSFRDFFEVIKNNPIIVALGAALKWLWENALVPLGKWISANPDLIINMLIGLAAVLAGGALAKGIIGLGSSLVGLIAANPAVAVLIAVAAAIALIGMAIWTESERIRQADLKKRFGDIKLSIEEMKAVAEWLTTSELSVKIGVFVAEKEKLNTLKKSIEADINVLNKYNWMISVGMQLTPDQISEYKATIDKFITDVDSYIVQKHYVATLAIDIILGDSALGTELTQFANKFYTEQQAELAKLGSKLRTVVNDAFADGVVTAEELATITNLQKEIQEILDRVSEGDFKAKLKVLELSTDGTKLTAESFTGVMTEAQKLLDEQMSGLKEAKVETLSVVYQQMQANIESGMSQTAAKALADNQTKIIEEEFRNRQLELTAKTTNFGFATLQTAFSTELETYQTETSDYVNGFYTRAVANGFTDAAGNIKTPADEYVAGVVAAVKESQTSYKDMGDVAFFTDILGMSDGGFASFSAVAPEIQANVKKMLETMKPTHEQLAEIAKAGLESGKSVPANVAKGLNDVNELAAIAGVQSANNYNIGKMLSTDASFLALLATSTDAGKSLDSNMALGLAANIGLITNETTGTITAIKNTATGEITKITPELEANLKTLGIGMADGLLQGADTEMQKNKSSWTDWAWLPWNWFKEKNEIESPSKLFARGGVNIVKGLAQGISDQMPTFVTGWTTAIGDFWTNDVAPWFTAEKWSAIGDNALKGLMAGMSNIGSKITTWGKDFVNGITHFFEMKSPSKLMEREIGENLGLGIVNGIDNTYNDMLSSVTDIYDEITTQTDTAIKGIESKYNSLSLKSIPITFDAQVDYQAMMNQIMAKGDLMTSSDYMQLQSLEQQRNLKIDTLGLALEKTDMFGVTGKFKDFVALQEQGNLTITEFKSDYLSNYEESTEATTTRSDAMNSLIQTNMDMVNTNFERSLQVQTATFKNQESFNGYFYVFISGEISRMIQAIDAISIMASGEMGIEHFATGGFPSGDIFSANEKTPEYVGSYGNNPAVANNDMIVDGISAGVAEGMQYANEAVVNAIYQVLGVAENIYAKPALSDTDVASSNARGQSKRGVQMSRNTGFRY